MMYRTRHAETRMRQRGVRWADIELVLNCGTQLAPDVWFMRDVDASREIADLKRTFRRIERTLQKGKQRLERALKRRIQRLERLRGLQVIVVGEAVLTSYRPSLAHQRRARRMGKRDRL